MVVIRTEPPVGSGPSHGVAILIVFTISRLVHRFIQAWPRLTVGGSYTFILNCVLHSILFAMT